MYQKYDVVFADINPKKWHTQAWIRPCIIIQNNIFNTKSPTIIIIPLTSNLKKPFPSEFIIKASKENWLKEDSRFIGSQIITIDRDYITEKIWKLDSIYHQEMKKAIMIALDTEDDF